MSSNNILRVLVASSSVIIRSGLASVLRRLHELNIQPVEISTPEMLEHYVTLQTPDIIMIDPSFGGWFDLTEFKETYDKLTGVKYIAIVASVIDSNQLKDYQEQIALYDSVEVIADKLNALMQSEDDSQNNDTEPLSQREKEIITQVVKGLTNKEIADQLCLSVHTVITHRRNIARKLQIHSPAGLTIYAIVNKLVELKDVEL